MTVPVAYEGRGLSGPPLVLIHGFPVDAGMWRGQLDGLGGLARVVAPDLPGFGRTPPLGTATAAMDDLADLLITLADALGFGRFVACGLSMGGYIALSLARRHPDRLAGLVLCDTRAEADTPQAKQARFADAQRVEQEGPEFLVAKHARSLVSADTQERKPDRVPAIEAMIRRATGAAAVLRGMADRRDAREDLKGIAVPTLVVVGGDDAITPAAGARQMASAIPHADFAVIPRVGHLSPFESPDPVNTAIRKVLRRAKS